MPAFGSCDGVCGVSRVNGAERRGVDLLPGQRALLDFGGGDRLLLDFRRGDGVLLQLLRANAVLAELRGGEGCGPAECK